MNITVNVVCRKDKANKNGTTPIHLRFTRGSKIRCVSTGTAIVPTAWDAQNRRIIIQNEEPQEIQYRIDSLLAEYHKRLKRLEILEADIIIVSGMIACAGRPIYLRSGQIVRGADKFSGLKFNFEDQARSVIFLEEFSKVQNLKIDVAANSYPSADRMQAVFEINGRCAVLENIFAEIKVYESRAQRYRQYAGIYPRHELQLAGTVYFRCRGCYVVPVAYCPLATSRLVSCGVKLICEGGKIPEFDRFELRGKNFVIDIRTAVK